MSHRCLRTRFQWLLASRIDGRPTFTLGFPKDQILVFDNRDRSYPVPISAEILNVNVPPHHQAVATLDLDRAVPADATELSLRFTHSTDGLAKPVEANVNHGQEKGEVQIGLGADSPSTRITPDQVRRRTRSPRVLQRHPGRGRTRTETKAIQLSWAQAPARPTTTTTSRRGCGPGAAAESREGRPHERPDVCHRREARRAAWS